MAIGFDSLFIFVIVPFVICPGVNAIIKRIMKSRRHEPRFILRTNGYATIFLFLPILGIITATQSIFQDNVAYNVGVVLGFALAAATLMVPSFLLDLFLGRGKEKKVTAEEFT